MYVREDPELVWWYAKEGWLPLVCGSYICTTYYGGPVQPTYAPSVNAGVI